MKVFLRTALLAVGLLAAGAAQAANAIVTADLNVRAGPGTKYRTLGAIPNRARVDVSGCTSGYGWCQVRYGGLHGWASSRYLATRVGSSGNYQSNNFSNNAAAIGIPLIAGVVIGSAINSRNDRYYRDDYYGRPHWNRPHRPNRPHWNHNRPGRPHWDRPNRPNRPHWNNSGRPNGNHGRPRPHRYN